MYGLIKYGLVKIKFADDSLFQKQFQKKQKTSKHMLWDIYQYSFILHNKDTIAVLYSIQYIFILVEVIAQYNKEYLLF